MRISAAFHSLEGSHDCMSKPWRGGFWKRGAWGTANVNQRDGCHHVPLRTGELCGSPLSKKGRVPAIPPSSGVSGPMMQDPLHRGPGFVIRIFLLPV
jgi:hypothetical protein